MTQAYRDYQAALDAGDADALLEAAARAYEAGDEADIDRATLATLAENYGFAASLHEDFETSKTAWRISARLSDRADADPVERAWRWHNASLAALSNQDRIDAYSCSRNAIDALEEIGADLGEASEFAGDAFLTRAALLMGRGRIDEAGEAALRSVAEFERTLQEPHSSYGLAHFYSGIARTLDHEFEDASYSLHMAIDVVSDTAPDHPDRRTIWAALVSAQGNLYDDDEAVQEAAFARLDERLAANRFHSDLYSDGAADQRYAESEDEAEAEAEDACCDAVPVRRNPPDYPMGAAYADLDGVVYLTFAVTEEGRADAIEVTGAFPPGVFEEAAIEAVERWTYEPATRDGEPVRREGVETRFDFRMQR
ncbi:energy transducer TonB [Maricaulis sp.]|uniref:energy transducer TonB n=1 Tax=Maricaulis sp. TaxID=1486257 RepID=UPI002B268FE5|nr:energy transducer TonB [Maricaulis sp.]